MLAHEYSHHIQFVFAGFPYYRYKFDPPAPVTPFAKRYEIGPKRGSAFIDGLLIPELWCVIEDAIERLNDIICEGLLREKKLICGFLEYYEIVTKFEDPVKPHFPPIV